MAKKAPQFGEAGKTGLPVVAGRVQDDPVSSLTREKWHEAVRLMSSTDGSIRSMLFAIEMIARQVEWKILPWDGKAENDDLAEFVRECLFEDMETTWQDTVAEILSMLEWGWAWLEMVYKRRGGQSDDPTKNSRYTDGRIGWRKWAIRSQESLYEWIINENDELEAMLQKPAPDYIDRIVPRSKSLHFRTSVRKNNPEGVSILRGAYRSWYFKSNIENIEGIGIERDLAGLPVIEAPPEIFKSNATEDQKAMLSYLTELATKVRRDESEGIVFPVQYNDKGHKLYDIRLLTTGGSRQFDTSAVIDRYDQRMLMSAMADFLLLGAKSVGSYGLMEKKWDAFLKAMKTWLDLICEVVNRQAIPQLLKLNGKPLDKAPYLQAGTLENISLKDLGTFVNVLRNAGVTFDSEQEDYLKRQGGIPVKDS